MQMIWKLRDYANMNSGVKITRDDAQTGVRMSLYSGLPHRRQPIFRVQVALVMLKSPYAKMKKSIKECRYFPSRILAARNSLYKPADVFKITFF